MKTAIIALLLVLMFTVGFFVGYAQSRLDTLRDCAGVITVNGPVEIAGAGDQGYRAVRP